MVQVVDTGFAEPKQSEALGVFRPCLSHDPGCQNFGKWVSQLGRNRHRPGSPPGSPGNQQAMAAVPC